MHKELDEEHKKEEREDAARNIGEADELMASDSSWDRSMKRVQAELDEEHRREDAPRNIDEGTDPEMEDIPNREPGPDYSSDEFLNKPAAPPEEQEQEDPSVLRVQKELDEEHRREQLEDLLK